MKRNVIQLASVHIDATTDRKTIWIVDAHGDDGKRFIVHADEKLTALVELELIGAAERPEECGAREIRVDRLSPCW